jgi:glycosyltransferase involved in cell wall biosynthesis
MDEKKKQRKRSFRDIIISYSKAICYAIIEPILLKTARSKYKKYYLKKEKKPLISVYCPTYNRGKLLMERAVKSVLSQTYRNFEFIIIGDCCTDDTAELISKIKDKRIRFYNIPKRRYRFPETAENLWLAGPVVAANKALEMVKGKWIARIDDDDTWTRDHLEVLLDYAQKGNYEFVSSSYEEKRRGKKKIIDGQRAQGPYYTTKDKSAKGYNPKIGGTQT